MAGLRIFVELLLQTVFLQNVLDRIVVFGNDVINQIAGGADHRVVELFHLIRGIAFIALHLRGLTGLAGVRHRTGLLGRADLEDRNFFGSGHGGEVDAVIGYAVVFQSVYRKCLAVGVFCLHIGKSTGGNDVCRQLVNVHGISGICLAGISTGDDVYKAIKSGADATGGTSGIVAAPDPYAKLEEMFEALDRARKDFCQ